MKITIPENLKPLEIIRRAGYGSVNDGSSEPSFARRLGSGFYPRFHAYLNDQTINLHLDQKQASYEGYTKHSGEYEGEVVEREAARIEETIARLQTDDSTSQEQETESKKTGWFSGLFGK